MRFGHKDLPCTPGASWWHEGESTKCLVDLGASGMSIHACLLSVPEHTLGPIRQPRTRRRRSRAAWTARARRAGSASSASCGCRREGEVQRAVLGWVGGGRPEHTAAGHSNANEPTGRARMMPHLATAGSKAAGASVRVWRPPLRRIGALNRLVMA